MSLWTLVHLTYNYSLNSVDNDTSTEISWSELTPIGQRQVLMFNGEQELNFLFTSKACSVVQNVSRISKET